MEKEFVNTKDNIIVLNVMEKEDVNIVKLKNNVNNVIINFLLLKIITCFML